MGGYGSGRWSHHTKKTTVEECRCLDANEMMREGVLQANVWRQGGWVWKNAYTEEEVASIGYVMDAQETEGWLELRYTLTGPGKEVEDFDYKVELGTTRPYFGGLRWWFICPLVVNGRPCQRRVTKLYRPPNGSYYGCRVCHDLTYKSVQQHDKRRDFWRRHPEVVLSMFHDEASPSKQLRAAKVILDTAFGRV